MKTALIRQPAGMGDILFCQKIARLLLDKKRVDRVIWPVIKEYEYIKDYVQYPNLTFINETHDFDFKQYYQTEYSHLYENDELIYIPVQHADRALPYNENTGNHPMYVKYELCNNLEYTDWVDYINLTRNYEREEKLINHLNINLNEPFVLVNKYFGARPDSKPVQHIKNNFDANVVEMTDVGFDNLFDWIGILDKAQEVHTVETSLCYIATLINKTDMHIYSRNTVTDFKYIKNVFPKEWNYYSL